ncbi:MAG: biosynthetic-type acetolactate synthase large subunit [Spirochaetales bacterium]|nr:biosynthetic-type acetolactate synthase large subunit [Spirochaetales bacterium]
MKKGQTTGAKALIKALESEGVEYIFGYPGGATLPIYDELARSPIKHILARHEQGAAHMADGYARASGKVGVCMATSGPGATNLVTGIATAYMDSSPVVAITGQVSRSMIGNDAFQEVDTTGITIPITKHNYLVKNASDIPAIVKEAFYLASTGRKGPVLIDIPKDVQQEFFNLREGRKIQLEGYKPTVTGHPGQIKRSVQLIKNSKNPLIIAGGGIVNADASEVILELTEKVSIPVVHTLMGKSSIPNNHPLYFGMLGYHGRIAANTAVNRADLIIAAGVRFGDRSTGPLNTFAKQAKIIHIDIDPAEIGKNVPAFLPIVGDAKKVLVQITKLLPELKHNKWIDSLRKVDAEHPLPFKTEGVTIQNIIRILKEKAKNPVLVTDVGKHQMFAAHYFPVDMGRTFLTSGGLGTMGFSVPAAIGAKVAVGEKSVVDIAGDGSFLMTCQQITTAVQYNIPVLILIMNDYCLGMIHQLQDVLYGKRYQSCDLEKIVDYAKLAESLGARGIRVTEDSEIEPAVLEGLNNRRPTVIDFILEEKPNAYPMVVGKSLLEYVE